MGASPWGRRGPPESAESVRRRIQQNPRGLMSGPDKGVLKAYQSRCEIGGKMFLVRVIVDDAAEPAVVVTAYRTTKIAKYWGKL